MRRSILSATALTAGSILLPSAALAETVHVQLESFEEVPAVSSPASGAFRAFIDDDAGTIRYELTYSGLEGDVRMSHIHLGQRSVNGGISIWLCQTAEFLDPAGLAPTCVQSGTVIGVVTQANVVGPAGQGIAPAEFAEIVAAIRAGAAYVNVHSSTFPGGEIRGQL